MKTYLVLIIIFIPFCFCRCFNQKYLTKKQIVFKVEPIVTPAGVMTSEIRAYTNGNNKLKVNIEESNGMLSIKKASGEPNNFVNLVTVQSNFTPTFTYAQLELNGKFYFPETTYPKTGDANSNMTFSSKTKLVYTENKIVLQTITIPLKIRHKIDNPKYKDSLPTQVESGFNAGFAFGFKRTWNIFKPEVNLFGQNTVKLAATPGIFFNLGGADVKRATTNYTISVDRKEAFYSYGIFLLFGFNNINLGYSIGSDFLFSKNRKNWVYQGKAWQGITVALDIIK
jgi:hypothetical protein